MSSISNQSVRSLERNRDVKRPLRKPKKTDCHDLLLSLASSKRPVILNEGPRTLWFLGVQYELTPSQFVVAKMLVDKWYPRFVGLTESEFRGKSDKTSSTGFRNKDGAEALSSTSQVKSCFKKSPLWGYLLVRTEKRRLTLNLPYFGSSKEEVIAPPCPEALCLGRSVPQKFARRTGRKEKKSRN